MHVSVGVGTGADEITVDESVDDVVVGALSRVEVVLMEEAGNAGEMRA